MSGLRESGAAIDAVSRELARLHQFVQRLASADTSLRTAVLAAQDRMINERLGALLAEVPLQRLARRVKFSALESAGVRTAADVLRFTHHQLLAIPGVGESTASEIRAGATAKAKELRGGVSGYPDPDRQTEAGAALLQSLAALDACFREVAPQIPELTERARALDLAVANLKSNGGWFRRAVSAQARDLAVNEAGRLLEDLRATVRTVTALLETCDPSSYDRTELWSAYGRNNSSVVALLERVARSTSIGTSTPNQARHSAPPLTAPAPQRGRPVIDLRPDPTRAPPSQSQGGTRPTIDLRPQQPNTGLFPPTSATPPPRIPTQYPTPNVHVHRPVGGPDPLGGLPPELARKIEAFALQTGPLLASLRGYQDFGTRFMALQGRVILGDDMGLGKTVQVLALMCHLHAQGRRHFLVVAPNSLLVNWERETRQHTRLQPHILHGAGLSSGLSRWMRAGGVAITTYGTLRTFAQQFDPGVRIDLLVADEAHYAKNPDAKRTQATLAIARRSDYVALLTGTAIENRLDELATLVHIASPAMRHLIDTLSGPFAPEPSTVRTQLAPVYLRRKQSDVLDELPECTETVEWVALGSSDRRAYEAATGQLMTVRKAAVVGAGHATSGKIGRLRELLDTYRAEEKKVVVFTYFKDVLDLVGQVASDYHRIDGDVPTLSRQNIVENFGRRSGFAVLAAQINTGGEGLNLQAAQVVILMEPQFTPSKERQAIARVHRMGQSRRVTVHRLVALDTIEDRMLQLLARKLGVFSAYVDPSALKEASDAAVDKAMHEVERELQAMLESERRHGTTGTTGVRHNE